MVATAKPPSVCPIFRAVWLYTWVQIPAGPISSVSSLGSETVTLTANQIPAHTHQITAQAGEGNAQSPVGNYFAASSADQYASTPAATTGPILNFNSGSQPHNNIQPYLVLNYIISLFGVFPSQN